MGTLVNPGKAVSDDQEWEKIAAEFLRTSRTRRWLRMFTARFFRAGETPQVFLSAVWAMVMLAYPDSLSSSYLNMFMPREAWAVLFSMFAVIQTALLIRGCLLPRAIIAVGNSVLWGFCASVVLVYSPNGSALGPTLCVLTAGCLVTTGKLVRMYRDWPL